MVVQFTEMAQLVQDYQNHAQRYRHMFSKLLLANHLDSIGHETYGDGKEDLATIKQSPFRKSVWKSGFGGTYNRCEHQ